MKTLLLTAIALMSCNSLTSTEQDCSYESWINQLSNVTEPGIYITRVCGDDYEVKYSCEEEDDRIVCYALD